MSNNNGPAAIRKAAEHFLDWKGNGRPMGNIVLPRNLAEAVLAALATSTKEPTP